MGRRQPLCTSAREKHSCTRARSLLSGNCHERVARPDDRSTEITRRDRMLPIDLETPATVVIIPPQPGQRPARQPRPDGA